MPRRSKRVHATLLAGLVLVLVPEAAWADHSVFFFQLDSARVVGNASGGAGCFEDFAGGLGGWSPAIGSPVASGGFVEFQSPGQAVGVLRTFYDLQLEREDIQAPLGCDVVLGGGDATLTTQWVNHVPATPGDFYGHQLVYALSPTLAESMLVSVTNLGAAVAAELGQPPGLQLSLSRLLLDTTDPGDIVLAAPTQTQSVPIFAAQLAGATGQRVYLRLFYEDSSATVAASYSLDAEASYQVFAWQTSSFAGLAPARFWATGAATTPSKEVPVLSAPGGMLLAGLLVAASVAALRSSRRPHP